MPVLAFYILLYTALCCFSVQKLYGQAALQKQYTAENGLPSSEVYDIIQDEFGYLWIATDRGLCRYDGYDFDYYSTQDGLTDNTIFNFTKDPKGTIWCTTFNKKIFSIKGKNPVFTPYPFNDELTKISAFFIINNLHIDEDNHFYFTFINAVGFLSIDAAGKTSNTIQKKNNKDTQILLLSDSLGGIAFYENPAASIQNNRLTLNNLGLYKAKKKNNNFRLDGMLSSQSQFQYVSCGNTLIILQKDSKRSVQLNTEVIQAGKVDEQTCWIATKEDGVQLFTDSFSVSASYLKGKLVTSVYKDHEGSLWIATLNHGIFHFDNTPIQPLPDAQKAAVVDMLVDSSNALWISYSYGDVLRYSAGKMKQIKQAPLRKPAHLLYSQADDCVFYSSNDYLFNSKTEDSVRVSYHTNMYVGEPFEKHQIVFLNRGWNIHNKFEQRKTRLDISKDFRVQDAIQYKDSTFFATSKGLFHFTQDSFALLDLSEELRDIRFDDLEVFGHQLACASKGKGLFLYNKGSLQQYTSEDGLRSNYISKLYAENDSILWLCTNRGVNRLVLTSEGRFEVEHIGTEDGLLSNETTAIQIYNDTVWIGSKAGINYFPYHSILQSKPSFERFLSLQAVAVNDSLLLNLEPSLALNYKQNRLEFYFSAISFNEKAPLRYRYKLKGYDNKWSYARQRKVLYTALAPGNYQLQVQVQGTDDRWSDTVVSPDIYIAPPFWKTAWFISIVLISLCSIIYLFFRYRILVYNRDIVRELLRLALKRLKKKSFYVVVKEKGKDIRIDTSTILYVKSDGNYIEIHTENGKHTVRHKIGEFMSLVPDKLEFLRIRRSHIIRIDKVDEKSKKEVFIGGEKIVVGATYLQQLEKIKF